MPRHDNLEFRMRHIEHQITQYEHRHRSDKSFAIQLEGVAMIVFSLLAAASWTA
jgi:hypothetical protein